MPMHTHSKHTLEFWERGQKIHIGEKKTSSTNAVGPTGLLHRQEWDQSLISHSAIKLIPNGLRALCLLQKKIDNTPEIIGTGKGFLN